jgi:cation:H+ antiporter
MLALVIASAGTSGTLSPWVSVAMLFGGLVLLLVSAHYLVDLATWIAHRLGVSQLTIGLTIIAFGTSAPELALNVVAAISSDAGAELAFGNVVGSNIANIGLVLGFACLCYGVQANRQVLRVYYPLLVVTEVLLLVIAKVTGEFTRVDGLILLLGLPIAVAILRRWSGGGSSDQEPAEAGSTTRGTASMAGLLLLSIFMLIAGAKLAETGAVQIARTAGLSEAVIGLTVVAIATSLPESFTAIMAARRGQSDLVMGTILGSNIFNILSVLAVTSLVRPVPLPHEVGWASLWPMLLFTLAVLPIYLSRWRDKRATGGSSGHGRLGKVWGGVTFAAWIGCMVFFLFIGQDDTPATDDAQMGRSSPPAEAAGGS